MITDIMKQEMAMLEDALEGAIKSNLPPLASTFIMNSPKYTEYLTKVENVLFTFMDSETAEIDGKLAHAMLSEKYPGVTQYVSIPRRNFKIAEIVNDISNIFVGRNLLT